ncbi:MAG TPA: PD-(D/E)XK nuclease family protein [Solirubrobacteraceae bacterium]|nr:PD-(D/E)XK nuclease family protein [Solirubrobacteraceae bacterium]
MRAQLDGLSTGARREAQTGAEDAGAPAATVPRAAFEPAEVRDVMAWLTLLTEPQDAAAAVRALGRPPVELRQVDLAQVVQVARRQKLDVVAALGVASESAQLAPQARERIERFQELHTWASQALRAEPLEVFVVHLIERLGLRRRRRFAADARELGGDARARAGTGSGAGSGAHAGTGSGAGSGAHARTGSGAGSGAHAGTGPDDAGADAGARPEDDALQEILGLLREEVLGDVTRIAGRLGELRLDTDLDVSHGIVRYLELIKLAALAERAPGQAGEQSLADINARLLAATTPLQREIYESSLLDDLIAGPEHERGARGAALGPRGEPSLEAFLPRRGEGLALSASDVVTYRGCPLRYKFARVLRIPSEQTLNQRFGIVVHQVLERYHSAEEQTLGLMMELLEAAWRRAGIGEGEHERRLRVMARAALVRYHERLREEDARPLWFERSFAFDLGPHHVRGRVDRVDALPDGSYELIDYKTGHARTAAELRDDIQLSLYAIAAREAWQLESSRQSYYYLLDDRRVAVPRAEGGAEWVRDAVLRVGEGILAQDFEPTPSPAVCALCDYRIVCPVAER